MIATIHHLTITLKNLNSDYVGTLCELLHIPRNQWQKVEYKDSLSLKYAFKGCDESAYIRLGVADDGGCYNYPRITLHGSFFDNSPDFDPFIFLDTLRESTTVSFKELDVAYVEKESKAVISYDQWCKWAQEYPLYFAGDMMRKSKATLVNDGIYVDRVQINAAKSKSAYASIYRRDNMIRFEVKYRSKLSAVIETILKSADAFQQNAINELSRQLTVCKKGTAHTRKQEIHPRFKKYLQITPELQTLAALRLEQQNSRHNNDTYKPTAASKRVAGYLNNFIAKHPHSFLDLWKQLSPDTIKEFTDQVELEKF